MNALLLLTAVLSQAIPQAQHHPENALVFAELPDMQGLLAAYEDVSSVRLWRDPDVRAELAELWSSVEIDLDSALGQIQQATGLPPEALRSPVAALVSCLDQVSGASLSISLAEARPGECAETIRRMHASLVALRGIEDALYLHAVEHADRFPSDLAELGPDVAAAADPWGGSYAYTAREEGAGFELRCLGADGAVGGGGPDTDLSARSDVVQLIAGEFERRIGATLCATFRRPEDAERVLGLLTGLSAKAGLQPTSGKAAATPETDLTWYALPGERIPPLWVLRAGGLLALGGGSSDPGELLLRSAGKLPSALESAGYRHLTERLGERGGTTVVRACMELADVVAALRSAIPVEVVNLTFFEPYARSIWRTGIENGRFVTETLALPGEHSPVTQCMAHEPVPEEIWKYIPAEAVGVYATTIDAPLFFQMILEALQADFKEAHVSKLSKLEEQYGFSLEGDVFGSMGSGAAGYMLPLSGLMSVPGMAVVVELDDPARFQKGLEGLLKFLEDQSGGEFKVQYRPYREVPLWYFSFENTGAPIPISPSLVIQEGHLFATLTSTRAKKEIKRLQDLAAPAEPSAAGAPPEDGAAPPLPEIHVVRSLAPPDATAVGYMDWAQLFAGAYDGGKAALALMGGGLDLPFDPVLLPEAELFTQFYEPSFYWTRVSEDAVYSRGESSIGPEALLGAIGIAGLAAVVVQEAIGVKPPPAVTTTPKVPETAAEPVVLEPAAQLEATRESLRFLATRLAVYKLEIKRYPARLDDLLLPTGSFPRGFLDGRELPRDAWKNSFSYSASADGSGYRLWSMGPDGVDQSGEGDDLVN